MVRISDRLRTVAHMCEKGAVVADIGTDHGYLPIYLVQEGIAPSAIAMDLRKVHSIKQRSIYVIIV